jgi:hypothetical protein
LYFLGCLNTPCKGKRFCKEHVESATKFTDDSADMDNKCGTLKLEGRKKNEDVDVMALKIINDKQTRNGKFYEVYIILQECKG